jgi:hypothetical protein
MTVQIDGVDVMNAIEIAAIVGGLLVTLIVGFVFYLMVRPVRHRREKRPVEPDALDVEEMLGLLDRMEQRLAVLERAVGDDGRREERLLETGAAGAEDRRTQ